MEAITSTFHRPSRPRQRARPVLLRSPQTLSGLVPRIEIARVTCGTPAATRTVTTTLTLLPFNRCWLVPLPWHFDSVPGHRSLATEARPWPLRKWRTEAACVTDSGLNCSRF